MAVTLDFTSALYLGMHHGSASLRPWRQLTTGRPAALAEPIAAREVASQLAQLQGCEAATLGPSTLHLFWDLFGQLSQSRAAIYTGACLYPIARWGIERAAARGVPVRHFREHDARMLTRQLNRDARHRRRPIVVSDGYCPGCGRLAPLAAYLDRVRELGGCLVIDDTQALGVLGRDRGAQSPYGIEGGGSLLWSRIADPNVLVLSSLAKGFGVPLAVISGSHEMIARFRRRSETRIHCSPPSLAVLSAADHALALNRERGDSLRLRLVQLVRQFRDRLADISLSAQGGLFPVQTLTPIPGLDASMLHERLLRSAVRTVLHRAGNATGARISFLFTALHRPNDIDLAVGTLADAVPVAHAKAGRLGGAS